MVTTGIFPWCCEAAGSRSDWWNSRGRTTQLHCLCPCPRPSLFIVICYTYHCLCFQWKDSKLWVFGIVLTLGCFQVTVTQFLKWFNGKVQPGLLGSTSHLGSCLNKTKRARPGASLQEHLSLEQGLWGLGQMRMVNPPSCMVLREFFHTNPAALSSLQVRIFHLWR